MTTMMAPFALLSSLDINVLVNQPLRLVRLLSELTSTVFCGSSMMKRSPPRPVRAPITVVDLRNPRNVVTISFSWLRAIRIRGNARLYHSRGDNRSKITGVLVREFSAVADHEDLGPGIVSEHVSRKRDRDHQGFQGAWRRC